MSEDSPNLHQKGRNSNCGCWFFGVFLVFVGYVLSPPFLIAGYDYAPREVQELMQPVLKVFFFPLETAAQRFGWVETFYNWYLGLFGWF